MSFNKLSQQSVKIAGGKGASLGEMTQAGLPVPAGYVVLARAFDRFLEETDLNSEVEAQLKKVKHTDINSVDKASNKIRDLINDQTVPKDIAKAVIENFNKLAVKWVAVRSSATAEDSKVASWAGELETFLYVGEKELVESVKKCWSSLFTARAIFYRFEKKLTKVPVSVAVVVQQMVDAIVSGVAFSVHPVTQDKNQLIIEAGWGLGEAIVSGAVTPDAYVVHKKENTILDINISSQAKQMMMARRGGSQFKPVPLARRSKQKLTGAQIIALAGIIKKIEQRYGCPQDIEWALAKGKFYILQSRPITTLSATF